MGESMSILGWTSFLCIAAFLFRRAALTAQDDEPHASLAQVISGATYLTLLLCGTFPLVVLWSTALALQFYYFPTRYQRRRHDYYPEELLPLINLVVALVEICVWCLFQQIR
jgi:hypothetical protein